MSVERSMSSRQITRRGLHRLGGAAALLALGGCEPEPQSPKPTSAPLRVGASYWPGQYWVDIAHRQGGFRAAGLQVEWVDTNADYFGSFDALVEGRLDIVCFTLFDLVRYQARGHDLAGFLASDQSAGADALVARPGIGRVRDLAGRRLGLPRGTYLEYLWTVLREREGLDPGAVQIVDLAGEQAREGLSAGTVDAAFSWEPYAEQARAAVQGQRLFDTARVPGIMWAVYAAQRETLAQRPADIAAFVRVWRRTDAFLRRQADAALAIVAEVNKRPLSEVRDLMKLDRVLDLRDNLLAFSYASGFDSLHGTARRMNDFMLDHGLTEVRVDTTRLLEPRFVGALGDSHSGGGP